MNKKKLNNKGFSLVELIIVIAIMAVLVGVLAPTYLGYVEKSKKSTDVQNAQELATAIAVYATAHDLPQTTGTAWSELTDTTYTDGIALPSQRVNTTNTWFYQYDGKLVKVGTGATGGTTAIELYPNVTDAAYKQ